MKPQDIRELTPDELAKNLEDSKRELLNLRIQSATGQLENTARIRQLRRHIARINTEQTVRAKAS